MFLAVLQFLGASTLKQLLAPCMRDVMPHLEIGESMRGGVDMSSVIHIKLRLHSSDILLHEEWDKFEEDIRQTFMRLDQLGAGVMVVMDGKRLAGKLPNAKRASGRRLAMDKVVAAKAGAVDAAASDLGAAVGMLNVDAAMRCIPILKSLGIETSVAPVEADHQLVKNMANGLIQFILVNDGDYLVIGGDNLLFDSACWRGVSQLFQRSNLGEWVSQGKQSPNANTCTTPAAKRTKTAHGGVPRKKHAEPDATDMRQAINTHGFPAVLLYALAATNDYANISGCGHATAMACTVLVCASKDVTLRALAAAIVAQVKPRAGGSWETEQVRCRSCTWPLACWRHAARQRAPAAALHHACACMHACALGMRTAWRTWWGRAGQPPGTAAVPVACVFKCQRVPSLARRTSSGCSRRGC